MLCMISKIVWALFAKVTEGLTANTVHPEHEKISWPHSHEENEWLKGKFCRWSVLNIKIEYIQTLANIITGFVIV